MRLSISLFLSCLVLLLPPLAEATTLAQVSIDELLKEADVVVVVEVSTGSVIKVGEEYCGVTFSGVVTDVVKGKIQAGSIINFVSDSGATVPGRKIAFLTSSESPSLHIYSTNLNALVEGAKTEETCENVRPNFRVLHSGVALFDVEHASKYDHSKSKFEEYLVLNGWAAAIDDKHVGLPTNINKFKRDLEDDRTWTESWVREEELLKYLKKKSSPAKKRITIE